MIAQVLSDLHFEFHRDAGRSFVAGLDPSGVDLLILAGDIYPWDRDEERRTFEGLCASYPNVLYVPGNHELYGFIEDRFQYKADLLRDIRNLYMPMNTAVTINGVRFLGTTLWFEDTPENVLLARYYNDFTAIPDFVPWVYEECALARQFLTQEIRSDDVVVTHFLPAQASVATKFVGSDLNRFFVCDEEGLIAERQPRLWVHGHTHYHQDYHIGATRVLANPLGYPGETSVSGFCEKALIEL